MSKIKKYATIGTIAATAATFHTSGTNDEKLYDNNSDSNKEYYMANPDSLEELDCPRFEDYIENTNKQTNTNQKKRMAEKVYHRFENIPEISDKDALLYERDEYIYIMNADEYQKNGTIKLKRVLSQEVTKVNLLSLIYRSENETYIPKENEDSIACYKIDFTVINPTGTYKGPSQMDDNVAASFIKYLAINPATRERVLPLLKYSRSTQKCTPSSLDSALIIMEQFCYDENHNMRPLDVRKGIMFNKVFKNIHVNTTAWQKLASPKLKRYIAREEQKRNKVLSGTTKCFLCLSELFPDEELLTCELETYNLTTFPIGRRGNPKQIMMALALSLNLKDNEGNLDPTRIPLFAIAASISTVNWHGNGLEAISEAKRFQYTYKHNPKNYFNQLKTLAKKWTAGKGRVYGVNEISQMNIITPRVIEQFKSMELPGAERLEQGYSQAVETAENNVQKIKAQQLLLSMATWKNQTIK